MRTRKKIFAHLIHINLTDDNLEKLQNIRIHFIKKYMKGNHTNSAVIRMIIDEYYTNYVQDKE